MSILYLVAQRLRNKEHYLLSSSTLRGWDVPIGSTR